MLNFLLELVPCLLIGFWLGGQHPDFSTRLAQPLVRFGVPVSVMGLLLRGGLSGAVLKAAAVAPVVVSLWFLAVSIRSAGEAHSSAALRLGSCVGNTAYVGVPLALAFLPEQALPITIGYDLGATLFTWSAGALVLAGGSVQSRSVFQGVVQGLLSSPASRGLLGALLVQCTPWSAGFAEALWWPSRLVLVLALGVVGLRLGALFEQRSISGVQTRGLRGALVGKLLLFPLLVLLLGLLLRWDPLMVQALVLQGATPTAISVLLIAESADRDQADAASLVFWSTVLALITAPLWGQVLRMLVR
jgi:predicted permease